MKYSLLFILLLGSVLITKAQNVSDLPAGKYETKTKTAQNKWEKGDIILLDDTHYKLSSGGDAGEYKFSVAAQRIFFTSGPLKSAFTKVTLSGGKPAIILPIAENEILGLTAEIWASKQ
ncbi:MAG: hypothetical protein EOO10_02900 [Chitinophagaceae bacterium]|nr:MAG: hypothetical protein EOO10_02900 [Chitinophagaceae bacterium]